MRGSLRLSAISALKMLLFVFSRLLACGFRHFHSINLRVAIEIGAKDDPFVVRAELHVGLEGVVVLRHVDELFSFQSSVGLRRKQVNPFPVLRVRDHAIIAAIAGEKLSIRGDVVVDRPFIARDGIVDFLHCRRRRKETLIFQSAARSRFRSEFPYVVSYSNPSQKELLTLWHLQVEPDSLAVMTPEFV